jgi:hypothetical protein
MPHRSQSRWRQSDVGADGVGADGIGADESTYISISQEDLVLMQVCAKSTQSAQPSRGSQLCTSCAEVEYYF